MSTTRTPSESGGVHQRKVRTAGDHHGNKFTHSNQLESSITTSPPQPLSPEPFPWPRRGTLWKNPPKWLGQEVLARMAPYTQGNKDSSQDGSTTAAPITTQPSSGHAASDTLLPPSCSESSAPIGDRRTTLRSWKHRRQQADLGSSGRVRNGRKRGKDKWKYVIVEQLKGKRLKMYKSKSCH